MSSRVLRVWMCSWLRLLMCCWCVCCVRKVWLRVVVSWLVSVKVWLRVVKVVRVVVVY